MKNSAYRKDNLDEAFYYLNLLFNGKFPAVDQVPMIVDIVGVAASGRPRGRVGTGRRGGNRYPGSRSRGSGGSDDYGHRSGHPAHQWAAVGGLEGGAAAAPLG